MNEMMLLNDFYQITGVQEDGGQAWRIQLHLCPGHPLYAGHFPGQPVVPGVCMLQILKEVAEQVLGRHLEIHRVASCKFLAVVDPATGAYWQVSLQLTPSENDTWLLQGHCASEAGVFVKAKIELRERSSE